MTALVRKDRAPTLTVDEMVTVACFASNRYNAVALTCHLLRMRADEQASRAASAVTPTPDSRVR